MLGQFPANKSMVTGSRSTQRPCKSPDCRPRLIQVPTRSQSHSTECVSRPTITAADSDAARPCAGHPGARYDCDCQPASHHRRGASAGRGHRHFGNLPAPGARASGDVVEAAHRYFRGQDVLVEPRNMWPSGLPDSRGKIRFLAPGAPWSSPTIRPGTTSSQRWVSARACFALDHGWARRRTAPLVAELGAAGRGGRHAVAALSDAGSLRRRTHCGGWPLPLVHALAISGPPAGVDAASAVRAKDLLHPTALAPGVSFTGPVLFVDDTIRTRWT
jgi:hypothetical protein